MATKRSTERKIVTADFLLKNSNNGAIRTIVNRTSEEIDAAVLKAHKVGGNHTTYNLPTTFDINGMDLKDVQTVVYSEIIRMYQDVGFDVNIRFVSETRVQLRLKWQNGISNEEKAERKKLIEQVTIQ